MFLVGQRKLLCGIQVKFMEDASEGCSSITAVRSEYALVLRKLDWYIETLLSGKETPRIGFNMDSECRLSVKSQLFELNLLFPSMNKGEHRCLATVLFPFNEELKSIPMRKSSMEMIEEKQ